MPPLWGLPYYGRQGCLQEFHLYLFSRHGCDGSAHVGDLFPQLVATQRTLEICSHNLWRLGARWRFVPTTCGGSAHAGDLSPQLVAAQRTLEISSHNLWRLFCHLFFLAACGINKKKLKSRTNYPNIIRNRIKTQRQERKAAKSAVRCLICVNFALKIT